MKPIIATLVFFLSAGALYASHPEGKEVYQQKCFSCHGDADAMAESREQLEWEKLMFSSKRPFLDLHKDNKDAYEKIAHKCKDATKEKLFAFFVHNAEDLGKLPSCE